MNPIHCFRSWIEICLHCYTSWFDDRIFIKGIDLRNNIEKQIKIISKATSITFSFHFQTNCNGLFLHRLRLLAHCVKSILFYPYLKCTLNNKRKMHFQDVRSHVPASFIVSSFQLNSYWIHLNLIISYNAVTRSLQRAEIL